MEKALKMEHFQGLFQILDKHVTHLRASGYQASIGPDFSFLGAVEK